MIDEFNEMHQEMKDWRHHLHQCPELAFEEIATSQFIVNKLKSFGLQVHSGLAKTGVVATLKGKTDGTSIALRADMDALPIKEQNDFEYCSKNEGIMHACGHDGHSVMLLGAAKYLAKTRNFSGTVYFIFQPAEEARAGGKQMMDDGLFELFPAETIYGMHNFPCISAGKFAVKSGSVMASFDTFEIQVTGTGGHAAMPHLAKDAIIASAQIITALQTIVSRSINPLEGVVVSVTQVQAGNAWNIIPETALIRGTFRCFKSTIQQEIKNRIEQITHSICQSFNISASVHFNSENPGYPVTCNAVKETEVAAGVAAQLVGSDNVDRCPPSSMGSEDFSFMLQEKPGCYILIGNGTSEGGCMLHNPSYDFNDEILPLGACYWAKLVETVLVRIFGIGSKVGHIA